jgi:hypothetical protein
MFKTQAMAWFIKRGDPVDETETKRIHFCQNFSVEDGRPNEAVLDIKCDEVSSEAPIHPDQNCRTLVTLRADLRSITDEDMESTRIKHANGKWYYEIDGDVEATYLSASTKYTLLFLDKQYDTVSAEYA